MTRNLMLCALVLIAFGCKGEQDPTEPTAEVEASPSRGPAPLEVTEVEAPAAPQAAVDEAPADRAPNEAEPTTPVAPAPEESARDLAAELRAAVGHPRDCIKDYRPASARTIRVSITAVVRPTGMIIEPSASGPGLSMNDRRCIAERVGDVMLEPLLGQASEGVATYVEIQYEPPAVEAYDVAPPPEEPDNVVHSLPKKKPIAPSGVPIDGPDADPIEGPDAVPIDGPDGVPITGPKPVPIESD